MYVASNESKVHGSAVMLLEEVLNDFCKEHKLRFWCVSAMYENNIPESVIMKYAGHKDVNTTRHYNRSRLFLSENDEVRSLFAI